MADMNEVYDALRNAHAAGDTAAAQRLAVYIESQSAQQEQPIQPVHTTPVQQPPEKQRSLADKILIDAPTALVHHVANLPVGIAQGANNLINAGVQAVGSKSAADSFGSWTDSLNHQVKKREADYQAAIPNSGYATAGAIAGEVLPFTASAVTKPLAAAGTLLSNFLAKRGITGLTGRIASGVGQGAIVGAALPVTEDDYAKSKLHQIEGGAAFGGAIPAVGSALGIAYDAAHSIVNPIVNSKDAALERFISDAGGIDRARSAVDLAMQAKPTLSGRSVTIGQAGKNEGLAATERAMQQRNPENFDELFKAQQYGRIDAMKKIAQDPEIVADAIKNRDSAAESLYGKAFSSDAMRRELSAKELADKVRNASGGIPQSEGAYAQQMELPPMSEGLTELSKRPGFNAAVQQAKTMAANKGVQLSDPLQSLQGLHYVKLALDDMLNPQAATAMGRNASAAVMDMRNKLAEELTNVSPLYGNARSTYADMSTPINQMQVGQRLTDVLTGEAFKHGAEPKLGAEAFFRAMKNEGAITKAETGMRQPLDKLFAPEQMQTINRVADELGMAVDAQNLGRRAGSDTMQKLHRSQLLNDMIQLANVHPAAKAALNVATLGAQGRVANRLSELLQNPETAQAALSNVGQKNSNNLVKMLRSNPLMEQLIYPAGNAP